MSELLLTMEGGSAGYAGQPVIRDIDLEVGAGEIVCLLGANGAGKTTTMLAMAGELPMLAGSVRLGGSVTTAPLHRRARQGLAFVPEERSVLRGMTVRDNLRCAGVSPSTAIALFPELEKCLGRLGGLISGGEQQMLSLARALGRGPRVLLADELSMGLAPLVVDRLLHAVRDATRTTGLGALIVEQHARKALRYADRVYVMERGRIVVALTAAEAEARIEEIESAYMGSAYAGAPAPAKKGKKHG